MPRKPRMKSNTKVYHVIIRGNAKQDIFYDKQDYIKFINEIINSKEKYGYELYEYCLMTNHVHLIIYDKNENLSKIMQSLNVSYSAYYNKKYEREGHLYQNRFVSRNVETAEYLKNLSRYIHKNPEKAAISKVEEYKWSSYKEYVGEAKIIEKTQILKLFGKNEKDAINQFIQFHKSGYDSVENLLEFEMLERISDELAIKYIKETLEIENIQKIKEYSTEKRNEYLRKLKKLKGLTKAQIARIIGLNEKMIQRILK